MQNASAMPVRFARLVTDRKQRVASMSSARFSCRLRRSTAISTSIEGAVGIIDGVQSVEVGIADATVRVTYDDTRVELVDQEGHRGAGLRRIRLTEALPLPCGGSSWKATFEAVSPPRGVNP